MHSSHRGSRDIEHIGSAHDQAQLAAWRSVARQRLAAGQDELDLGLDDSPQAGGPLEITGSRMGTCGMHSAVPMTCSGSARWW